MSRVPDRTFPCPRPPNASHGKIRSGLRVKTNSGRNNEYGINKGQQHMEHLSQKENQDMQGTKVQTDMKTMTGNKSTNKYKDREQTYS